MDKNFPKTLLKPNYTKKSKKNQVDDAFSQLMNEISTVANDINTSLTRKSESLSRESSRSPTRAINECRVSRLVYPRVTSTQNFPTKVELMHRNGQVNEAADASSKKLSQIPLFIKETCELMVKDDVRIGIDFNEFSFQKKCSIVLKIKLLACDFYFISRVQ